MRKAVYMIYFVQNSQAGAPVNQNRKVRVIEDKDDSVVVQYYVNGKLETRELCEGQFF